MFDCKLPGVDELACSKLPGVDELACCKLPGVDGLACSKLPGVDELACCKLPNADELPGGAKERSVSGGGAWGAAVAGRLQQQSGAPRRCKTSTSRRGTSAIAFGRQPPGCSRTSRAAQTHNIGTRGASRDRKMDIGTVLPTRFCIYPKYRLVLRII